MKFRLVCLAVTFSVVAMLRPVPALGQTRIVTGRVMDSLTRDLVNSGQASVQGTTISTTVKDDGTFTLAVPPRDVVLSIRSVGFKRREVSVPAGESAVQVALERDYFQLEAIVVTGQATGVERRNLANAVATVSAEQLVKMPASGIEQTLIGKLSGADIEFKTSAPGGGSRVRLRGVNTLTGGRDPLYVIDGVIASDAVINSGTGLITAGGANNPTNRIADLNPNDIENVEVLKGAAASAIYGSKASTGVILITTKRGRSGAPQFNVIQRFGTFALSHKVGMRRFNSVADAVEAYGAIAATYYNDQFYDHEQELYGNRSLSYETIANSSGGSDNTQFFLSGLVKHDAGVVTNTYADKQSLRLNLDQAVGSRVKLGASTQVVRSEAARGLFANDNSGVGYGLSIPHIPSFFDLRQNPDGTWPQNPFIASNPLETAAKLENVEIVWRSILAGNFSVDLVRTPSQSLRVLGNGGIDFFAQKNRVYSPPDLQFEDDDGLPGTASLTNTDNLNKNVNANVVHILKAPSGALTATTSVGIQREWRALDNVVSTARNLLGSRQLVGAGTVTSLSESRTEVKDEGFFLQEEVLTLRDHLMVTLGARADRSSNNADPKKLFYFPKAAGSYRVTAGNGLVDEIKVRAAVGASGNQPTIGQKYTTLAGGNIAGILTTNLGTSTGALDLHPERQLETEGGIDATLFGGRANLEATVYLKKITDLLLQRSVPTSLGFSTQVFNGGELRTKGFEGSLNMMLIQRAAVQWSSRVNFSASRSTVTKLPVPSYQNGNNLVGFTNIKAGESPTLLYGFDTLADGSAILVPYGNKDPSLQVGISNDVGFKRLKLYFLWDWKKGGLSSDGAVRHFDLSLNAEQSCSSRNAAGLCNGRVRSDLFYGRKSLRAYVVDNSWVKLREATLSYELPRAWISSIWSGARYLRLSLAGRNLLTFTPWMGYDPEGTESGGDTTPTRELGAYPPSRSFWISLDLGF